MGICIKGIFPFNIYYYEEQLIMQSVNDLMQSAGGMDTDENRF